MLDALHKHLLEKPGLYQDEMADFLWDKFGVLVTRFNLSRAFTSIGWFKKTIRQVAKDRNADLRDMYLRNLSEFRSYHLVYIDESGCDKRVGFGRTAQDGILLSRIFRGSTNAAIFEDFIEQLLHHCGKFPEPKSVLIMDNASFHRTDRIEQMCSEAGVKLMYLPPYSPDLNPIEEMFAKLKGFIKRNWDIYEDNPEQGFDTFLEWCIDMVGSKKTKCRGTFQTRWC